MRVTLCVDALDTQLTGIGRYTWELCKRLPGRAEISALQFFGGHRLIDNPSMLLRGDMIRRARWPRRLADRFRKTRALRSSLVHGPNFFLPDEADGGVITIHDLSVLRFPETHPIARVQQFERLLENSIGRASHIITDTETVREEVITEFGLAPERVSAVPLGVDESFHPRTYNDLAEVLLPLGLAPGGYGLSVATLEPRKKFAELLQAWRRLPRAVRNAFPLVIAGAAGWNNEDLAAQISRGQQEGWLRHLGFVDDLILPRIYAGAALFAYPSVYEGFGLPPIEAMASGTPVLVSNRSCLPEVCGDAAGYIDPDDVPGMTAAIERSLTSGPWQERARAKGLEQAGKYSWELCLDGTVSVYRRAWDAR